MTWRILTTQNRSRSGFGIRRSPRAADRFTAPLQSGNRFRNPVIFIQIRSRVSGMETDQFLPYRYVLQEGPSDTSSRINAPEEGKALNEKNHEGLKNRARRRAPFLIDS